MKKVSLLLVVAFIAGYNAFADESTIIDFSTIVADYETVKAVGNQAAVKDNTATLMDFSSAAGESFSAEDKAQMKISLAIERWDVILNSSARSVINLKDSTTKIAVLKKDTSNASLKTGTQVMGVRVHFPVENWNAVAEIRPPFEIPAYMDKDDATGKVDDKDKNVGAKFVGYGVVKNVGTIKSITATIRGLNFPHKLTVVLKDQTGAESEYLLSSSLNFDGWKAVTWDNPNYVNDVRDRELKIFPLYPNSMPYVKLAYFKIYKDASIEGGDFVTYIKDLSIIYDKAVINLERDIDDELVWNILQSKETDRRNAELKRLGGLQVLRFLEGKKTTSETKTGTATTTGAK